MKKIILSSRFLPLLLLVILLFPSPLYAEGGGALGPFSFFIPSYVGIGGSYVREDFQKEINFSDTGGLNLKVGFDFFKVLTLELNFDYLPSFEGSGLVAGSTQKEETDVLNFMVVGKFPLALSHPLFKPSLLFGMGVFYSVQDFKGKIAGNDVSKEETDTGLSMKFGGSLEIYLTPNFTLGAEGAFVQLLGSNNKNDDKIKFFLLTFFVAYKF